MNYLSLPVLALFFIIYTPLAAQGINSGGRFTALGNSGVALQDIWSLQSNQAGLASLENPGAAIAYQSNYLNTELFTKSAVFAYPVRNNVVGLSLQTYGISAYNDQRIGLAYARRFDKSLFIALNFNFHQLNIPQYGSAQTVSVEAGLQYQINHRLLFGTHISNPNKMGYDGIDSTIPTALQIGASYKFSDKVVLSSALVKDLNSVTDARFGLEYDILEYLFLRGGLNLNPFTQFAGFGCKYLRFNVDVAVSYHSYLGYSPQIALGYDF